MCWKQGLGKNTKQELSVINQPVPKSYTADVNSGPSQLRGQDGPFVTEEGSWRICIFSEGTASSQFLFQLRTCGN